MRRFGLTGALALLALAALIVGVAAVFDVANRAASPERVVRRYFSALEAGDVEGALQEIVPSGRPAATSFVENGAGNHYRITGIAVEQTSLLDRLRGQSAGPREVTIFLDITQSLDGVRWQAGPRVPLVEAGGRWYVAWPPLMPAVPASPGAWRPLVPDE